jgi:quinol monooxygenase YgiN
MATLLVHLKAREGQEENFERSSRQLYEATHRLEKGCRRYEFWRGAEPRRYYCLLSFDDFVAFIEHQTSEHHEEPDYDTMLEEVHIEWVDPVQGASDLVPTESRPMPEGASELMKTYSGQFAAEIQDWWSKFR